MIKNWIISGDKHGDMSGILEILRANPQDSTAIIVLGDLGLYFSFDKKERAKRDTVNSTHNYVYWLRGNHEEAYFNIAELKPIWDENVHGIVWCNEQRHPYIRCLVDGGTYNINGHSVLVLGGAYSVDKEYRIRWNVGWFPDEQIDPYTQDKILADETGKSYDFILSHTCPYDWEPRDLFMRGVDQNLVDKRTEMWLNKIKENVKYNIWLFGHFHDDRLVRPHVEMLFTDFCELEEIWNRWNGGACPPYWNYDPNYFIKDNQWQGE